MVVDDKVTASCSCVILIIVVVLQLSHCPCNKDMGYYYSNVTISADSVLLLSTVAEHDLVGDIALWWSLMVPSPQAYIGYSLFGVNLPISRIVILKLKTSIKAIHKSLFT